ncbi:hypothetical protein A5765_21680 [Mycolicibacterium celeriflavum]|nr:hypothetical protein A5765_21680 [Mycolicibacterium celeriflavum]
MGEDGQLDTVGHGALQPDEVDGGAQTVEAEIVESVAKKAARREVKRTLTSYRGPIPPAAELQAYDNVLPGAAERILHMAEKSLESQIEVDTTLAHGDVASIRRGQWQSTAIVGASLIFAFAAVLLDAPWQVVAVFLVPGIFEFGSSLVRAIREPTSRDVQSES